jgi:hypothetical protein
MPYILYERSGSNHKKLIGLFETKEMAQIYSEMNDCFGDVRAVKNVIEKIEFLDTDPKLVEYILRGKKDFVAKE